MKLKNLLKNELTWVFVILILMFLIMEFFLKPELTISSTNCDDSKNNNRIKQAEITDTTETGFSYSDSLPCWKVEILKDSIKQVSDERKRINEGGDVEYQFSFPNFIGTAIVYDKREEKEEFKLFCKNSNEKFQLEKKLKEATNKDTIKAIKNRIDYLTATMCANESVPYKERIKNKSYFISLNPYKFIDSINYPDYYINKRFLVNDNKYYIKYVIFDSVRNKTIYGRFAYKQIGVKYVAKGNNLLIPISLKSYNILNKLIGLAVFLTLFYIIYAFILLPLKCIIKISKGNPFALSNIRSLHLIAFFLMAYPFLVLLPKILIHFLFRKTIPYEFTFNYWECFYSNSTYLISGIIVLFVARAFKRGYDLQKEQELTI